MHAFLLCQTLPTTTNNEAPRTTNIFFIVTSCRPMNSGAGANLLVAICTRTGLLKLALVIVLPSHTLKIHYQHTISHFIQLPLIMIRDEVAHSDHIFLLCDFCYTVRVHL